MDSLIKDLRFGMRSLLKRPGFTAIAVLTLALGIGANTAIFSVVNATLMRPPAVADPDRLVYVFNGPAGSVFSYPDYTAFRDQNTVFDGLLAIGGITASLNSNDQTDLVTGAIITGNFFEVLGVRAQLGRVISTEDDKTPGSHPVVVISQGSLRQAQTIDPGFDAEKIVTLPLNINLLRYTRTQGREFYRQVVDRVEAIPGVESASLARIAAVSGGSSIRSLLIEGRAGSGNQFRSEGSGAAPGDAESISSNVIGPRYFQTMGIGLMQGRDFIAQDNEDHPLVVIVNEAFVRRHFPSGDVLGKRLSFGGQEGPWREIVGVVRTSKYFSLGEAPTPVVYLPLQQNHETGMNLHVRTTVDSSTVAGSIRNEVQALEKNLPLGTPERMSDRVTNSLYAARMGAILLAVFGGLALLLASIGLYGVMSFAVSRRTRELGIRVALGARPGDVFRLVLKQGMTLVIAGLVLGLVAAAMLTRLLTSFLYGVSAMDRLTFIAIPVLLAFVALLACYLPARRATKVEPLMALRYE